MNPIPCMHCGFNYMRSYNDKKRLCNSCLLSEERRTPSNKESNMRETIDILIKCPIEDQKTIEEICINQGIDFTRYFLELHYGRQACIEADKEFQEECKLRDSDLMNEPCGKPKKGAKK